MPFSTLHLNKQNFAMSIGSYIEKIELWLESESPRLPLFIVVFVALGISAWFTFGHSKAIFFWLPMIIIMCISLAFKFRSRISIIFFMSALCFVLGWSAIMLRSHSVSSPILSKPWVGHIYGRIASIEKLPSRDIVRLKLETDGKQSLPLQIRINVPQEKYDEKFTQGSIIRSKVRLLPPAGPAVPGAYDFSQRAWFEGLGATGSALDEIELIEQANNSQNIDAVRNNIAQHVREKMPGRAGSIGATLASGDRGAIAMEDAQAMRRSGLAHLLAISGLHVTAIVMMSFFLIAKTLALFPSFALRHKIPIYAASVAAIIAISYTILTGAQVPTIRACIAACLILAALTLGREPFTLRLVAFGALFILLLWPEVLVGPSFQLSFAAVAAIITLHETKYMQKLVHRRQESFIKAAGRFLISLFITGLVIEIILAPIALYHFQKTGVYGALANMIAIPLTTFVIIPSGAIAILMDSIGFGKPFWWVCAQSIEAIIILAHYVSNLPGAIKTTANISSGTYAIIIISAVFMMILQTKARWIAAFPLVIASLFLLRTSVPDILVTGDGNHLAVINSNDLIKNGNKETNEMLLLRSGAGDYIRELLNENAGFDGPAANIENWPNAKCSDDICIISVQYAEQQDPWTILATKSNNFVPAMELAAACRRVDMAFSNRYLPYSCKPKRLKIDRRFQQSSGGIAIYLSSNIVRNVASEQKHLPWSQYYEGRQTTYPTR